MKKGDRVKLNPLSIFAKQSSVPGTVTDIDDKDELYPIQVIWDNGNTYCYRASDLLYEHEKVEHILLQAMTEIALDNSLVELLKAWMEGPVENCPFIYGTRIRECSKLCFKLFPGTAPNCPCNVANRREIVETIIKMASFTKLPDTYRLGDIFTDDEELFLLATIGLHAQLICLTGTCYYGESFSFESHDCVKIPEDLVENLTHVGHISHITIAGGTTIIKK